MSDIIEEYKRLHPKKPFVPGKSYIAPSGPDIDPQDIQNLVDVVMKGWFTEWTSARSFSNKLAEHANKSFVTLVNSGSSANLVAVSAVCEDNPSPYFLTCAAGFPTTIAPIYQNGRIPVFVDIDPYTLQPNYLQIKEAFELYSDLIAGAILIHNLGFTYDEKYVRSLMSVMDQRLIVDGCDALGSFRMEQHGDMVVPRPVGHWGDYLTYSFFPAHVITTGEGGAVLTNDSYLHRAAQSYGSWGRSCWCSPGQSNTCGERFCWKGLADLPEGFDHKYVFDRIGYNLKMTELQAALGDSQMDRLPDFIKSRRDNYAVLLDGLSNLRASHSVHFYPLYDGVNPFGFPMLLPDSVDTNHFVSWLESKKIGTRRFFAGNIIRQPGYYLKPRIVMGNMQGADHVMEKLVWIGCYPALDRDRIEYMIDSISTYFLEVL